MSERLVELAGERVRRLSPEATGRLEGDARTVVGRLPELVAVMWALSEHRDASASLSRLCGAALHYFVLEKDAQPDSLGPVGLLDDIYAFAVVFAAARRLAPDAVDDCWRGAESPAVDIRTIQAAAGGYVSERSRKRIEASLASVLGEQE